MIPFDSRIFERDETNGYPGINNLKEILLSLGSSPSRFWTSLPCRFVNDFAELIRVVFKALCHRSLGGSTSW